MQLMSKPRKDEWVFKHYTAKEKLSLGEKETESVFHADLQQPAEAVNSFWLNKTNETSVENPLVRFFLSAHQTCQCERGQRTTKRVRAHTRLYMSAG